MVDVSRFPTAGQLEQWANTRAFNACQKVEKDLGPIDKIWSEFEYGDVPVFDEGAVERLLAKEDCLLCSYSHQEDTWVLALPLSGTDYAASAYDAYGQGTSQGGFVVRTSEAWTSEKEQREKDFFAACRAGMEVNKAYEEAVRLAQERAAAQSREFDEVSERLFSFRGYCVMTRTCRREIWPAPSLEETEKLLESGELFHH